MSNYVLDKELNPATNMGKMPCNEHKFNYAENRHYPIYGRIDLLDSFSTFAGVIVKANASKRKLTPNNNVISDGDLKAFSSQDFRDDISFTTSVKGSINPSIELNPVAGSLRLTAGSVSMSNHRKDTHKLVLILKENGVKEVFQKLQLERLESDGKGIIAVALQ